MCAAWRSSASGEWCDQYDVTAKKALRAGEGAAQRGRLVEIGMHHLGPGVAQCAGRRAVRMPRQRAHGEAAA
ncbi:MAG: hypothetical protein U1F67_13090 [Rubrivivax sp.]